MTIPLCVQLFSLLLGGGHTSAQQSRSLVNPDDAISPDIKLNSRFFLAANISLLLFVLAFILVPCVVVLPQIRHGLGLVCVAGVVLALLLSVLYLVRKGDLHWVRSFFRN